MLRRCAIIVALCVSVSPTLADPASSSFEVAPTTVDLSPGRPGLFYIANRGGNAVNIQIQTMDWHRAGFSPATSRQAAIRDMAVCLAAQISTATSAGCLFIRPSPRQRAALPISRPWTARPIPACAIRPVSALQRVRTVRSR
jgi:hypothetical protein